MKTQPLSLRWTTNLAIGVFSLLVCDVMATNEMPAIHPIDAKFIQEEAASGLALVKMGELGTNNAKRADIKAFAWMIVVDHIKSNSEIATLAASKYIKLAKKVDSKTAQTYEALEEKKGNGFDNQFLADVVSTQKRSIKNFEDAAQNAKDDDVRVWAAAMLPGMQAHVDKAESLLADSSTEKDSVAARELKIEPDQTVTKVRDRDHSLLPSLIQGNSRDDMETTAQIRKAIRESNGISVHAQNVKIITMGGHVTLQGQVNSAEEKRQIGEITNRVITEIHTDNQLEVIGENAAN